MRATRWPAHLGLPANRCPEARFMGWFTALSSDHRGDRAGE